jgi:hypothetical protein
VVWGLFCFIKPILPFFIGSGYAGLGNKRTSALIPNHFSRHAYPYFLAKAGEKIHFPGKNAPLQFAITTKTYPVFTPIYVLSDGSGYFASYDPNLDPAADSFLGQDREMKISFAIRGLDTPYTVYDGGTYQGLQLIVNDKKTGLIKIHCATPNSVPVPGAVWLLGSGLIGIATLRRKGKQQ